MEDRASAPLRLCHCPFCGVGRARPHGGRGARRARAARRGVGARARGPRRIARGTPHRRARMASLHARALAWDRSTNGSLPSGGVERRRDHGRATRRPRVGALVGGTSGSSLFKSTTERSHRHRRARCCARRCDATRRRPRAPRPASRRRCTAASASSGGGSPRLRRPSSSRRVTEWNVTVTDIPGSPRLRRPSSSRRVTECNVTVTDIPGSPRSRTPSSSRRVERMAWELCDRYIRGPARTTNLSSRHMTTQKEEERSNMAMATARARVRRKAQLGS